MPIDISKFNFNGERIYLSKSGKQPDAPDLLNVQIEAFKEFLQEDTAPNERNDKGMQAVFQRNFPISDSRETALLEFIEYYLEKPQYSIRECQEQGLTYAVSLKTKLRLSTKPNKEAKEYTNVVEQDVYMGNIPYMSPYGSFVINGAERVIVSQLHRAPGVVFSESMHQNGTKLFSARIIPMKGSWVEFTTDINNCLFAYIDRRKKFPVTTILRALGYSTNEEILDLFGLLEVVEKKDLKNCMGKQLSDDLIDKETGELIAEKAAEIDEELIEKINKSSITKIKLFKSDRPYEESLIANTLNKDAAQSEIDALEQISEQLRPDQDDESAKNLVDKLFFNEKKYDLGEVGRYKLNYKLGLDIPADKTVLTKEDIISIINYLVDLEAGRKEIDDIDHLGNRRVRSIGEQLSAQFNVGLARMSRTIRERMSIHDEENITPGNLVSARTITTALVSFFGTSQLSQYMDQTNPLSEMTHKRRVSALGPGGLTRERAGFEVRDVHYTHYGRLCPIETPEGPNIGLISSLCTHARISDFGFIETPYRKVKNGKVLNEIDYLSAEKEDDFTIAQVISDLDGNKITESKIKARFKGDFPIVNPEEVQYMDIAPNQIVSAAAALIPFLEHDDANRALMGSNMQRQAVPLLRPEAPLVGTGFEKKVANDSRTLILAEADGVIEHVSADRIVVKYDIDKNSDEALLSFDDEEVKEYNLIKFLRTNQDTSINQKPIVSVGQRVKKGDCLADGAATDKGELALGRSVLVAFMPWRGYNFEDAIVISERIVAEDIYTSVHIEEYNLQVRDTKRGEEELTRDIPNVSEEATKDLDEDGIIRIGAEVKENDILIGKVTPKGETEPTPEEKLLRAIFGDKAGDVKDASLKAPPGMKGIIINKKLFTRKQRDTETKKEEKKKLEKLEQDRYDAIADLNRKLAEKLGQIFDNKESLGIRDIDGSIIIRGGTSIKKDTFLKHLENPNFRIDNLDVSNDWTSSKKAQALLQHLYRNFKSRLSDIEERTKRNRNKIILGDELPTGVVKMAKVYIAKKKKLSVGDKMAGRHGNKGVVAKIVPRQDMPFLPDGTPVDIVLNPLGVPSRMNLGQLYETALGWAAKLLGCTFATPVFDGASFEDITDILVQSGLPSNSRSILYDGQTGEQFDQMVTVGFIYMMKLSHLSDDKIHARSIGPYSLITQQPLGGKAQFGGQRFGEMEVWALEGYGAAYTLQEILTVKSDDVTGRSKTYETLIKGENTPEPQVPESFNVLVKELQGLCLDISLD
ncbi:MAG: DNA-directed RNA polymerase subunit beta [Chlorobi bacterium OLB5]|nr:MAG: DNA-directed RNA polymerase subunit beta [Chlorobi bacterium OLB5]